MIPVLYNSDKTKKLGDLINTIDCGTEEERNGLFTLTLTYPITDGLHLNLVQDNLIEAKANDEQDKQLFRIYHTERIIKGTVTVKALHISFDLKDDLVLLVDLENATCQDALNRIFANTQFSQHYLGYSNIENPQRFVAKDKSPSEAICGSTGSIIDTYGLGAEIKRDNTNIYVFDHRGTNKGVTIEYGVNMLEENLQVDMTDLVTVIYPYAKYYTEDMQEIEIRANPVYSPLHESYDHDRIRFRDYSMYFTDGTIPTLESLRAFAQQEFDVNQVDRPKCSYTLDFVALSKCVGYSDVVDAIHLCDTVRIIDYRYNIDTEAKAIKYIYNVLTEQYDKIELGDPKTTLGDLFNADDLKGEQGEQGQRGEDGKDGDLSDFPNTLPSTPILSGVSGLGTIQLTWTYEKQIYYTYELYASTQENFTPTIFDLKYSGQGSSFLFTASAGVTWYFKLRCVNTHQSATEFSNQVSVTAGIIEAGTNLVGDNAITDSMINILSLRRTWNDTLPGNLVDFINARVVDKNNTVTFWVDEDGDVIINANALAIQNENVATQNYVASRLLDYNDKTEVQTIIYNRETIINKKIDDNRNEMFELMKDYDRCIVENTFEISKMKLGDDLNLYNMIARMIESGEYTEEYIVQRMDIFYLNAKLTTEEWNNLNDLIALHYDEEQGGGEE